MPAANFLEETMIRFGAIAMTGLLVAALAKPGLAQDPQAFKPDGPVKYVIGFAPGGIGDTVARLFADAVQRQLDQRVIVENRSGANGMIAFEQVAHGKADGMTVVQCGTGAMGVSPVLPGLVLPLDINKELLDAAKTKKGGLTYGHAGVGSLQHLAGAWLAQKAGAEMVGVSYRGIGPAMLDVIGGRLDLVVTSLGDFSSPAKSGQVRLLTLIDDVGSPAFPDAPQASATLPGYHVTGWVATCGPRGLSPAAIRWWEQASQAALKDPTLRARLADFGLIDGYQDHKAFAQTVANEQARWKAVIEAADIRAE
jgi:tripartite-type tricarboxylate transporter receptor subunit TctC